MFLKVCLIISTFAFNSVQILLKYCGTNIHMYVHAYICVYLKFISKLHIFSYCLEKKKYDPRLTNEIKNNKTNLEKTFYLQFI